MHVLYTDSPRQSSSSIRSSTSHLPPHLHSVAAAIVKDPVFLKVLENKKEKVRKSLQVHLVHYDIVDGAHECPVDGCSGTFTRSNGLKKHLERTHKMADVTIARNGEKKKEPLSALQTKYPNKPAKGMLNVCMDLEKMVACKKPKHKTRISLTKEVKVAEVPVRKMPSPEPANQPLDLDAVQSPPVRHFLTPAASPPPPPSTPPPEFQEIFPPIPVPDPIPLNEYHALIDVEAEDEMNTIVWE